jgi:alkanesulfonate monooxygenase SsuD/methylene tetrahydromethanopterin reductase-like flavin-dependent oxidoreductase (luciferase family)
VTPDQVRERCALLDDLLQRTGRHPADVRRTMNTWVICGRTSDELADRLRPYRLYRPLRDLPDDDLLTKLRTDWFAIIGTPEEVVAQIRTYKAAGIAELSMQWPGLDDVDGLELLASEVMPRLRAGS